MSAVSSLSWPEVSRGVDVFRFGHATVGLSSLALRGDACGGTRACPLGAPPWPLCASAEFCPPACLPILAAGPGPGEQPRGPPPHLWRPAHAPPHHTHTQPLPPPTTPTTPQLALALKSNPEGAPRELKVNANYITKFGQVGTGEGRAGTGGLVNECGQVGRGEGGCVAVQGSCCCYCCFAAGLWK